MLVLVRHGESEANAARQLVGRADSPLTELGRRQAVATGAALAAAAERAGTQVVDIVSSPLTRASETAAVIAGAYQDRLGTSPPVRVDERAVELDYGTLDGMALASVPSATWKAWQSDPAWRPPGGESLADVAARFASLLEEVAVPAEGGEVIVVSHVSPIKAGVAWALGVGVEVSWRLNLGLSCLTRIVTSSTRPPALLTYGETAHLGGL